MCYISLSKERILNQQPVKQETKNKYLNSSRKIGLIETDKKRALLRHMLYCSLPTTKLFRPSFRFPYGSRAVAGNSPRNRFPPPTPTAPVSRNIYQLADLCRQKLCCTILCERSWLDIKTQVRDSVDGHLLFVHVLSLADTGPSG